MRNALAGSTTVGSPLNSSSWIAAGFAAKKSASTVTLPNAGPLVTTAYSLGRRGPGLADPALESTTSLPGNRQRDAVTGFQSPAALTPLKRCAYSLRAPGIAAPARRADAPARRRRAARQEVPTA